MKYKYIYTKGKLLIEDECIAFLEDMSRQGWKLRNILFSIFIFERYDKPLKYQLDYSDYNLEYIDVIEELGYQYICLYNHIKFYYHKDLNAIDLQTDSSIRELILLKKNSIFYIIINFIFIFLIFILLQGEYGFELREKVPADFYINFNKEIISWCLYTLVICIIFQIIKKIDIRYKIKHGNFKLNSLICFHPIFRFLQYISFITFIGFIVFLLYFGLKSIILLGMFLTGLFLTNIAQKNLENQTYSARKDSKNKKTLTKLLTYSLSLLGISLVIFQVVMREKPLFIAPSDSNPYYEYRDLNINKESNLFLTKLDFSEIYNPNISSQDMIFHSETYYRVKDNRIANIIFEQMMIDNDFFTNETRLEEANKPIKERTELNHKTYEQVKQKFNHYKTTYADTCYYYKERLMAIKDNQVLDCTLDNVDNIGDILKYYFE